MIQENPPAIKEFLQNIVSGGYCIGCGVCASIPHSPLEIRMNQFGLFQAEMSGKSSSRTPNISLNTICPFSGESDDEETIARSLFASDGAYHDFIGYYINAYAGYVTQDTYRERGSSGGMGSWILAELLQRHLIDGVVHVHKDFTENHPHKLFTYHISTSVKEIQAGAKSRYYPVEISEIIQRIRKNPKRYAFVGVPCFIKALRLLAQADPLIKACIPFYVGLVCGHLKSRRFADLFGWQLGIEPGSLSDINFRYKLSYRKANRYGVECTGQINGHQKTFIVPVYRFFGVQWGYGFFKYQACDYCDDVVAETADIAIGDAWLRRYMKDSQGTNIVLVRHPQIQDIVNEGRANKQLQLEPVSVHDIIRSQEAGFRHRRDGLAYRLYLKQRNGARYPKKRVAPQSDHLSMQRKKIYEYRMQLAEQSHHAFCEAIDKGNFSEFVKQMNPLVQAYDRIYWPGWRKWARQGTKFMLRLLRL